MLILKFIGKRLLSGIVVMLGVVAVIFFLFSILPVNSAQLTLGQRSDEATKKATEKEFRLNLPHYKRLALYFNDLSPISIHNLRNEESPTFLKKSDANFISVFSLGTKTVVLKFPYLGKSFQTRGRVSEILSEKIYPTFILAVVSMLFAVAVGIILGVFAAIKQYSVWDNFILVFSTFGISQPAYFSAIVIAMIFGYYLSDYTHLFVCGSITDLDFDGNEIVKWKNLWLPVFALGIRPVAIITQLTRSTMLDVLSQDYIRTAKAKGLSYYKVIFKHGLRNALNPLATSIGGWLAALLTGAFFIENVFDYKGLGLQTIQSLLMFDFPVVMACVLFVAFIFVVMNILTDILYSVLDPRVSVK